MLLKTNLGGGACHTEKRISVRDLVEFILRRGSIDSRFTGVNRAEEGARVHRHLQKKGGENYKTEVFLSLTEDCGDVSVKVEGRADGVITDGENVTIDEIKTTLTPLANIEEDYNFLHWAQAICYGYIYCRKNGLDSINIRLTYYEMDSGEIKRFVKPFSLEELSAFFAELIEKYSVWVRFERDWKELSAKSFRGLEFPFEAYRPGQRKLAGAVYKTVQASAALFAVAPTGTGKTISTLFPSVKALGEGLAEKVFYLTAKTVTGRAAVDAVFKMAERGMRAKTVALTAKDKICFLDTRVCDPEHCKYANGHFDRVNDALFDLLNTRDTITAEVITEFAEKHTVCPFELALDVSNHCDIIICDYNYLFDPQVYLKRFFADSGDYIFLVDEAHNLVDRAREMYSARLNKSGFLDARKKIGKTYRKLRKVLSDINSLLLEKRRELEDFGYALNVRQERYSKFCDLVGAFIIEFAKWLGENRQPDDGLLEFYFNALAFQKMDELYDDRYVTVIEAARGSDLSVKLFCVDPSALLRSRVQAGRTAVFFSATLSPLEYFMSVLGGDETSKSLVLESPFPEENLCLIAADAISTKYRDRQKTLSDISEMIYETVSRKSGNYICYFPSYAYMEDVYALFSETHPEICTKKQLRTMPEAERTEFLSVFQSEPEETLLGFCVMGGIFSEGIDLEGDRLIGTVIVGVGLPQINAELDIVRDYYGRSGYDFAYLFPGMNKVLQAAGRVIRSETDVGVVLLIDERFGTYRYETLFPSHWRHCISAADKDALVTALDRFWNGKG